MASGERSSYFPAIERKHGQPMAYWFDVMAGMSDRRYPEQMAFLQEEHGFSRTHANALVQYCRGSTSSRRFDSVDEFLAQQDEPKRATIRAILAAVSAGFPDAEIVIAWNQPMVKRGGRYVFGVSAAAEHLLIAPFDDSVIEEFRPRLDAYHLNKKTIRVPVDWDVDVSLVQDLIAAQDR